MPVVRLLIAVITDAVIHYPGSMPDYAGAPRQCAPRDLNIIITSIKAIVCNSVLPKP